MVPAGLPIERSSIEKDKGSPFAGRALSLFLWVMMLRNGTFHCAVGGASIPSLSVFMMIIKIRWMVPIKANKAEVNPRRNNTGFPSSKK